MAFKDLESLSDLSNIAEELSQEELDSIGSTAKEGYDRDLASRADWDMRNEQWTKLAAQVIEHKNFPWENASNVKYPLLTTAAIQFHARAYPALIPANDIVKAKVIGFDPNGQKADSANRVAKHMSYQLMEEMEDWEEDMDKLCITLPIVGCAFKKTYYSPTLGKNVSELVHAKYLVVNYWTKNLADAYRKTHIIPMSENQVIERQRSGVFLDCDLGSPTQASYDVRSVEDEIQGITPTDDESTPYTILEQHTYLDLDEDGYKEPYIITFEEKSAKVLRIVANFDSEDIVYNESGDVVRIESFEHFTKFSFIPNPDGGFYDVGFGILLGPLNESSNTIINQLIDAGTLSNLQSGFLGRGVRLRKGDDRFKPGEWKQINIPGEDLRKGIYPLPVREPSGVLFNLLGMLLDSGQRLANTTDMLVGENPGQNQAATTSMIVMEQGLKVFTAIYKRIYRSLAKEYKKLFKLNSVYLRPENYFTVLDIDGQPVENIMQIDYNTESLNVVPEADPTVVSQAQKILKAQAALEMVPYGVNRGEAIKRVLEAQEQPNIESLLTPEQTGPDPELAFKMKELEVNASLKSRELDIKEAELGLKNEKQTSEAILKTRKQSADELAQLDQVVQRGRDDPRLHRDGIKKA